MFLLLKGELEERLEPFYYRPSIVELENKIRKIANGKLKDFALKMSSGATPLTSEEEKYYSDSANGVPFIRVQNLNSTNELSLEDLKYINYETHQKDLKRSQVSENDLLIKITGVGRMAIASVPPLGFEGNTNQHLVVIKTQDRLTSETLATYLNLDIIEKIATRRSTGGTRPALDYTALKSIPIVYKPETVEIVRRAIEEKKTKEAQAKALLESIDSYLLAELGITLPEKQENTLKNRVFLRNISEVSSGRFDVFYYQNEFIELNKILSKTNFTALKKITKITDGSHLSPYNDSTQLKKYVTVRDINSFDEIDFENCSRISEEDFETLVKTGCKPSKNDVLFSKDGTIGKVHVVKEDSDFVVLSSLAIITPQLNSILPDYLGIVLKANFTIQLIKRLMGGTAIQRIILANLKELQIPLPPLPIQERIVAEITTRREQAKRLQTEAKEVLEQAKAEVERMILGGDD